MNQLYFITICLVLSFLNNSLWAQKTKVEQKTEYSSLKLALENKEFVKTFDAHNRFHFDNLVSSIHHFQHLEELWLKGFPPSKLPALIKELKKLKKFLH